jgi:glyoxalase family protein
MKVDVDGLHHVTAIIADIGANLEFYSWLLGLRLVWQGVNADDPEMRHIAYGGERGTPGGGVTFFDMPGVTRAPPGAGMAHRLIFRVASKEALDLWERRLARAGVPSHRLADLLAFSDPEGLGLELVIDDGEDEPLVAAARGFVFEPPEHLGESLLLIGDLDRRRAELERRFPLLPNPWASTQASERTST